MQIFFVPFTTIIFPPIIDYLLSLEYHQFVQRMEWRRIKVKRLFTPNALN